MQWAAAAGRVDTLRWLQGRGLSLAHVNAVNHGAVVKAAWKGHLDALRWLLFAPDGPQLTDQLTLLNIEGKNVAELVRENNQHEAADWLDPLIKKQQQQNQKAMTDIITSR